MSRSENTPVSFLRDELDKIRDMMARGASFVCPICEGTLNVGDVGAGGGSQEHVWAWNCEPCKRTAILRDITRGTAVIDGLSGEPPTGSATVLVADDELLVREPIALLLRQAGYKILMTGDARDTVAVFREHAKEIAAVLLDCHMPGGCGEEVFEELQRIRPDIPVIMMSGYDEERIMGRFMGMGIVGFLQKPFGRVTLIDKVREALDPPAA
jgi:CheY-like chemotaxis protein